MLLGMVLVKENLIQKKDTQKMKQQFFLIKTKLEGNKCHYTV